MSEKHKISIDELKALWCRGDTLRVSNAILANLRPDDLPIWSAGLLNIIVLSASLDDQIFSQTVIIARTPDRWCEGHQQFSCIRRKVLSLYDAIRSAPTANQELELASLALAELIAKVTYNATSPADPFDEDSFESILSSVKAFDDYLADDNLSRKLCNHICKVCS